MVWYDFVILAILAYAAWQGAARGLMMQLAWIVAIVLCFKFADTLAPSIEPRIAVEPPLRHWIAMFILYLAFSLGSFMGARILSGAIEKAKLQDFDRHLGGLFGLLKGVLFSLVLTFFAVTLSESLRETVLQSHSGYIACQILDVVEPFTPEDAHPIIRDSLQQYKEKLEPLHGQHEHLGEHGDLSDIFDSGDNRDTTPPRGIDTQFSDDDFTFPRPGRDRAAQNGPTYQEFVDRLPPSWQQQIQNSLKTQWDELPENERQDLLTELRYSSESAIGGLLNDLLRSPSAGQGTEPDSADPRLIQAISEYYGDPESMAVTTRSYLSGLPAGVQTAVLNDWYADLTHGRDPDPSTTSDSRLDDRILNQLQQARIPLRKLNTTLRRRLEESIR